MFPYGRWRLTQHGEFWSVQGALITYFNPSAPDARFEIEVFEWPKGGGRGPRSWRVLGTKPFNFPQVGAILSADRGPRGFLPTTGFVVEDPDAREGPVEFFVFHDGVVPDDIDFIGDLEAQFSGQFFAFWVRSETLPDGSDPLDVPPRTALSGARVHFTRPLP